MLPPGRASSSKIVMRSPAIGVWGPSTQRSVRAYARPMDWIEHRRPGDRELLGWILPDGEDFAPCDRLGRAVGSPTDWLSAEERLEEHGIGWLADLWQYTVDGVTERVRIVEVTPERIVVKRDDFGTIDADLVTWTLAFPAPDALKPFEGDPGVLDSI